MRVCAADHPDAESARSRYRTLAASDDRRAGRAPAGDRAHAPAARAHGLDRPPDRRRRPLRRRARPGRRAGPAADAARGRDRLPAPGRRADAPRSRGAQSTSSTWQPRFAPALRRPERRMAREVRTLDVAPGEDGVRLDRWLRRRWPQLSHVQIHKLARSGQIRVDGGRVKADTRLTAGAQVRVPPLPETPASDDRGVSERDAAFARSLVLYEDDEVLALNKPSGLAVQGGTKTSRHVDRLLSVWGEGVERPRLVHRLDRDTSGVLVLGKGPAAAAWLAQAFAQRRAAEDLLGHRRRAPAAAERQRRRPAGQVRRRRARTDGAGGRGRYARGARGDRLRHPDRTPASARPGWRFARTPVAPISCGRT